MPFRSVVHPEELALLTKVLNDHCERFGIPHGPERDDVADLILKLFRVGKVGIDELEKSLATIRANRKSG